MVAPSTDPDVISEVEQVPGVTTGPVKILLDDPDLPSLDDLTGLVARAHESGRAVAVHCVTRVQLLLTLAALEQTTPGDGDRIEHGAMIPIEAVPRLVNRNLVVVTQPGFVAERGDQYLQAVAADELSDLWRGRSLIDGGVKVAAGSDAPFGSPDPWRAIRAAVRRRTGSGQVLGGSEAVDVATAPAVVVGKPVGPGPAPPPGTRRARRPGRARCAVGGGPGRRRPRSRRGDDRGGARGLFPLTFRP